MQIKKVYGNTYCIDTGKTFIPFYKINDDEIIMLDTGRAKREREGINEIIEKNNLKIAGIICSHAHIDHVGNNTYFKEKYKCILAMPAYEAHLCSSICNLKLFYMRHTYTDVEKRFGHMICETDILIHKSQEIVVICDVEFKIIHTPGHSPEHICIITPDNIAYLGDALISYEVMRVAKIPYTFILKDDLKSKKSLYNLKCSQYIVAHKDIYNDITNLISDNINHYKNRAEKIYEVIHHPMTAEEITKAVIENFNINVKDIYKYIKIDRMLRAHIEYLLETGMLELTIEDGLLKYVKGAIN